MDGFIGRQATLKIGSEDVAGVRSKGLEVEGTSVDVTTGEDNGYRKLLKNSGRKSINIPVDGVAKDATLRAKVLNAADDLIFEGMVWTYPIQDSANTIPETITGDFMLEGYSETTPYEEEGTFSGTFASTGVWTYAPESAAP